MSLMSLPQVSRRAWLKGAAALTVGSQLQPLFGFAPGEAAADLRLPEARPKAADRRFVSTAVEETIQRLQGRIGDPNLGVLFANCFPNTLDTTVWPGRFEGKPDTYVVTGDIDAMWLRDSSAQLWPYLPLLKGDAKLRELVEGVIRRQGRMIRIDPYANAFMRNPADPPLSWAVHDKTHHVPGVGERKWEIDSLCYPVRLAHGYWRETGDTAPFDGEWKQTAWTILETFRVQQRKAGPGPYSFQRESPVPTDTVPLGGFGNPARPVGLIFSMFRPSDDACIYPLFVPANLFAVTSLRQLAELAKEVFSDAKLREGCLELAGEVERALQQYGMTDDTAQERIWAYEVDGYGNVLKMDDANAPGLLSLAYLGCCAVDDPLYRRTRSFALSPANPYFFRGKAAEGIGGPHEGLNMIWPMSILMRALTSVDDGEIRQCLRWLRDTTAGTGFMHESFQCDNPKDFTRPWFAWANTLYGELILKLAKERPALLVAKLD
ncbi:glycoside hydrolase family 125 protein [Acidicapsa acidisoli]|uniref:glycoside hydrolase family 125 protein n=1 Tax=Acidicapsa acidisoli TaxID=1615681 RepID=UPI00295AB8D5|nr:glycoside hydrolase family 125 protein [Acidicapsa acidisoli]